VLRPQTASEIAPLVAELARKPARTRVIGALHSPNDIAMSDDTVIVLPGSEADIRVDAHRSVVTAPAGVTLGMLNAALAKAGFALPVLGSITKQTIAGAIATATHGTGLGFGTLSSLVESFEIATPGLGLIRAARHENTELFHAGRCSLGALGVHVSFTLRVVPAFNLSVREQPRRVDEALAAAAENLARHDYYRLWYLPHTGRMWEWQARRVPADSPTVLPAKKSLRRTWWTEGPVGRRLFEGVLFAATFNERLIPWLNRRYAAAQFDSASEWARPSAAAFAIDCLFRQHVDEWAIPIERTVEAVRSIEALIAGRRFTAQLPVEIRFAPADDVWLSPCYARPSCYIGIIAYRPFGRDFRFRPFFAAFEALMKALGGRPHWAKSFEVSPEEFAGMYERWGDFARVRERCDPHGVFANRFTDRLWPQGTL
jgi:L-gulonolactone oxidase